MISGMSGKAGRRLKLRPAKDLTVNPANVRSPGMTRTCAARAGNHLQRLGATRRIRAGIGSIRRDIMAGEKSVTEKTLNGLRPYAAHWGGTLGRGDLVIPQREIPRVIHEIIDAVREMTEGRREASDMDLFQVLKESRHLSSIQDQVGRLKDRFIVLKR